MTVTSALASFALVAGLLTVIPGLDTALVLRSALQDGRGAAVATALGINTGALVWGVAAAVGVSALLTASATAFAVLRLAGAAYLLWLGVAMLWRTRRGAAGPADLEAGPAPAAPDPAAPPRGSRGRLAAWRRGLLTNLLNPKVGVFYAATIPQFLPDGAPHVLMGVLLAFVHDLEAMVWFGLIIGAATLAHERLADIRVRHAVDRITGTVLVVFGARLALES